MLELSNNNAAEYLERKLGAPAEEWRITPLGGGVSNTVLLAERAGERLVLKQSLEKLRVAEEWISDRRRILRECAAIRVLGKLLPAGATPEVSIEDEENLILVMSAAPEGALSWKERIFAGEADPEVGARIGSIHAAMLGGSWRQERFRAEFGDLTVFDQLRLDPYYRFTAVRHPDLAHHLHALIEQATTRQVALVHGDWSPKNFLVQGQSVMLIDCEVIHYGDPCFDSAFLLNHLCLKWIHLPQIRAALRAAALGYWKALRSGLPEAAYWMEAGTLSHLGGLMLARIDGKSPAEYLRDENEKEKIRRFARALLTDPPLTIAELLDNLPQ